MRFLVFLFWAALTSLHAQSPVASLWNELAAKRNALPGFHQEVDLTSTYYTTSGPQSAKRRIVLDMAPGKWREASESGSGTYVRIHDGKDVLLIEEGGDEFVREKRRAKDGPPVPSLYTLDEPDWASAREIERPPCGFAKDDHPCVVLEIPLRNRARVVAPNNLTRVQGAVRVALDMQTGIVVSSRSRRQIENQRGGYDADTMYLTKRLSYGQPANAQLFQLPSEGMREVKELSPWNASKMRKQLVGKPAPELAAADLKGNPIRLSALKGKTVLLDFWTTWCPPCRADAPALDKLYRKYAGKDLEIVGISVSEDRAIVEKFLGEHPHSYPVVLTTENEMPRPYQVRVFPTYIVIDPSGNVTAAVEGDKGFGELRRLLKKAGLDTD